MATKETMPVKASEAIAPLWALAAEYRDLIDAIAEADGEMSTEIYERWQTLPGQLQQKVENCGRMVLVLEAQAQAAGAEAKRVQAIASGMLRAASALREYLGHHMDEAGVVKVDGTTARVRMQDNPPSCRVLDESAVPEQYKEVTVTTASRNFGLICSLLAAAGEHELMDCLVVKERVKAAEIIKEWKAAAGAVDVPGTRCDQARSVRIA